jgi:chromosomal replication initiator protein
VGTEHQDDLSPSKLLFDEISTRISLQQFETWFHNLPCRFEKPEKIVITAPNPFAKTWIENEFWEVLSTSVKAVFGIDLRIEIVVDPSESSHSSEAEEFDEKDILSALVAAALRNRGDFPPDHDDKALEDWLEKNKEKFVEEAAHKRKESLPIKSIWVEVEGELRERLGERYERWLAPLSILSESKEELRLGVPNTFWLEWVEKRYLREVAAAIDRRTGRAVRVTLAIDPALFRRLRQCQKLAGVPGADEAAAAPAFPGPLPCPAARAEVRASDLLAAGRTMPGGERQTLSTFVVGASNRLAHAASFQVVNAPGVLYNPLFIHGSCGLGKTHLLRGICEGLRARQPGSPVRYLNGEEFMNAFVTSLRGGTISRFRERYRAAQVMVIDDIHLLKGDKARTQEEFLHTINALVDGGHQVVIASDSHPKGIDNMPGSLIGRFLSGLVVEVGRPDFETRLEILRRRAARARVPAPDDVLEVVAERVRTNVRELIGAFNLLEETSFQGGKPIDRSRALAFLADSLRLDEAGPSLRRIAELVAWHFRTTVGELVSRSRVRSLNRTRQVAMFLARKHTNRSLAEIGAFFGGRNHTTVKAAEAKVETLRKTDPATAQDIMKIIDSFEE